MKNFLTYRIACVKVVADSRSGAASVVECEGLKHGS